MSRGRVIAFACVAVACGKTSATAPSPANPSEGAGRDGAVIVADAAPVVTEDPVVTDLWTRAEGDADADDLSRLCAAVGSDALIEASTVAERRMTVLRALAYADDFTALPFLAKVATSGTEEEAALALESIGENAARPRRATDPDDALEVHEGIALLVALAQDVKRLPARRILAIDALRLFADRGWVSRGDVPNDLDAH